MSSHVRRRPMWREFLLFIGTLYGTGTAAAFAVVIYASTVSHELTPRIGIAYCLMLVVVFAWVGGYSFAKWVRS